MRFVPVEELEKQGYGKYLKRFEQEGVWPEKNNVSTTSKKTQTAIIAGGCFWGMEELLRMQH